MKVSYEEPTIKIQTMKTSEGVKGGEQPTLPMSYPEFCNKTGNKFFRDYRRYLCSFDNGEVNNEPSMVEITHNLSLEQIMNDYCRGIVHSELERNGIYDADDNEEFEEPDFITDIVDLMPTAGTATAQRPSDDKERNERSDAGTERATNDGGSDESSAPKP